MDVLRLDLLYWQIIHSLVIRKGMRVIDLGANEKEILLENEDGKEKRFIRVVRMDLDWSKQLRNDLTFAANKMEILRKNLFIKQLQVDNLYISMYTPLDSFDDLTKNPLYVGKAKKTKITSNLFTFEEKAENMSSFFDQYDIEYPKIDMNEEIFLYQIDNLKAEVKNAAKERLDQEKALFSFGKPRMTYVLLVLIGIMFAILELNGGSTQISTLIEFGAKYNPLIEEGEWWRFISAMFLHIGFLHLFMNAFALFYLGNIVERIFGNIRFTFIYFVAGIFGSIASFSFNVQVSAGASGAIFGLFGALLYFGVIHQKLFFRTIGMNLIVILILNIGIGFMIPIIDNSAHLGGLLGGFLAASIVHLPKHRKSYKQIVFFVATVIALIGLLLFGLWNENKAGSHLIALQYAQELLQQEEYNQAYPILIEIVEDEVDIAEAYFLLAYAEAHLEKYEEAKHNLVKAIELRSNFHEAHYNLALIYIELEEYEKALLSVQRAISIEPSEAYETLETNLRQN